MSIHLRTDFPPSVLEDISYDPETGEFYRAKCHHKSKIGCRADHVDTHNDGYSFVTHKGRRYAAHRLAWLFIYGCLPNKLIDHINGIPSDNRIRNLRLATNSENMRNRGRNSGRKLPKGVSFNTAAGRYQASIGLNNRIHYLGLFDTVDEAFLAYAVGAFWFHREFARPL